LRYKTIFSPIDPEFYLSYLFKRTKIFSGSDHADSVLWHKTNQGK